MFHYEARNILVMSEFYKNQGKVIYAGGLSVAVKFAVMVLERVPDSLLLDPLQPHGGPVVIDGDLAHRIEALCGGFFAHRFAAEIARQS